MQTYLARPTEDLGINSIPVFKEMGRKQRDVEVDFIYARTLAVGCDGEKFRVDDCLDGKERI